ncbi:MAG: sensor histidine kinase, partial [Ramlibacter sp.]
MEIRTHLTRLVLASLLPAALAAAALISYSYELQKESVAENAQATARALTQAVDLELKSGIGALQALATSPYLADGDLMRFHRQAREALGGLPGNNIVVSDASGQQVLNTLRDYGEPLPLHGNLPQMRHVFATGEAMVSDLFEGAVAHRPLIAIDVPVRREGRIAYVMSMGFFPEQLAAILKGERLPADWVGVIVDRQGTIVARTHAPESYVGKMAAPALVRSIAERNEGRVDTPTLEGIPVVAVFSRSAVSNWSVAIGIPQAAFAAQLRSSLIWVVSGTFILLASGLALAQFLAGRIRRDIRALIPCATALARGEVVDVSALHLQLDEAGEVARALASAARTVQDREEILAVVTHDLRSPLSALILVAAVAEREARKLPEAERLRKSTATIRETALGMVGLVDDLLAVAVARGGRSMLKIAPTDTVTLLARAAEAVRPLFEKAGLALELNVPGELPQINVDAERILRVLRNLFDNALKFTEPHGRVVIGAEAHAGCVRIFVA